MKSWLRCLIQTQRYYYRSSIRAPVCPVPACIRGVEVTGSRLRYVVYRLQCRLYLLPLAVWICSGITYSVTYPAFKTTLQPATQTSSGLCRTIFRTTYILLLTTWIFDSRPSLSTQYGRIYSIQITGFVMSSNIEVLATSTTSFRSYLLL